MQNIYPFSAVTADGLPLKFETLKGKVVLIVNTASGCGFAPQFESLQQVYQKYKDRGLVILGFPSNDFGSQEPLSGRNLTIHCHENYNVEFPLMDKVSVKGKDAHPVFKFLSDKSVNGHTGLAPLWNFHKYIIDKKGYVRHYFLPVTQPDSGRVIRKIEQLLNETD